MRPIWPSSAFEQKAFFASFPVWMKAFWAIGVWGAIAGSLLLLLRSRHAVTAFGLSLAGLAINSFWQFALSGCEHQQGVWHWPADYDGAHLGLGDWAADLCAATGFWRRVALNLIA